MSGLSAVRKRPGMYLGNPQCENGHMSSAQLQMAQEILSNAIDEAQNGFGHVINMTVHKDNSLSIQDFGRGLPKGKNYDAAIRSLTVLHTSGKVDDDNYQSAAGQNGVGVKATNALSEYMTIDVTRMDEAHTHYFMKTKQEDILEKKTMPSKKSDPTGTTVTFRPDPTYFEVIDWDDDQLLQKLEQSAYLTSQVTFNFIDERKPAQTAEETKNDNQTLNDNNDDNQETESDAPTKLTIKHFPDEVPDNCPYYHRTFYTKHGMPEYIDHLVESQELISGLSKAIPFNGNYQSDKDRAKGIGAIKVDGGIIYTVDSSTEIHAFANGVPTLSEGPHVDGAKLGIYHAFRDYAQDHNLIKRGKRLEPADTRDGLVLAISVNVPGSILTFDDQAKTKFSTIQAKDAVKNVIYDVITTWLADHQKTAKSIITSMLDANQVREAAKKLKRDKQAARKSKSAGNGKLFVSSKLTPASSRKPEEKELYITEGDSACLTGDTMVRLADGRDLTIKELAARYDQSQVHYIESNDIANDTPIIIKPIFWAGITRKNAQVIRLWFNNHDHLDCTPDHQIMLTNHQYKRADQLTSADMISTREQAQRYVTNIESLSEKQDVYDLTIPETHNFYLSNGICVHNCGGLLKGRNPKTQGLFPIRGKILNTEGLHLAEILKNKEISTITSILGAGIGPAFDVKDLEYDKVIIASDADPDGYQIRALLITLFYNFFPGLIQAGHLYYVNAPLFKITHYNHGKQINDFVYTDAERDKLLKKYAHNKTRPQVARFKGLGEMSTQESEHTLLNPQYRYLTQVTSDNIDESKAALKLMMGKNAAGRKAYMEEHVDYDGTTE